MKEIVVVGAGIGGLSAAAALARAGADVTVLEAHVYPGGCAGTFYHQGFRFDAGATLAAGFFPDGPMDQVARAAGLESWPVRPAETAMEAHLPGGESIELRADVRRWEIRRNVFGPQAVDFFRWQETLADALWRLALDGLPWPPGDVRELSRLARGAAGLVGERGWRTAFSIADAALRPLARYLPAGDVPLRRFIDGQLLISAQTTSAQANALYGAAALDLPRRGVASVEGGMGGIAAALAQALETSGGRVLYRQPAARVVLEGGRPVAVETEQGEAFPADLVIFNLPAPNLRALLPAESSLRKQLPEAPPLDGWGAFTLYVGVDGGLVPGGFTLHHQLISENPAGEGADLFLSISPEWDPSRAPAGMRAITLSTHTARAPWPQLLEIGRGAYEARAHEVQARMLSGAERILPGLRDASRIVLPGTPVTFQRYTKRIGGWVGGYPQTSLLRARRPRIGQGLWMVGDSIFPGQSTAAVALGGLRVAASILSGAVLQPAPQMGSATVRLDPAAGGG